MAWVFLDDLRSPPPGDWTVFRSYEELADAIAIAGITWITHLAFDHDLGTIKTGYDLAVLMVNTGGFAEDFTYSIQSSNPVGRTNIKSLIDRYFQREFKESVSREVSRPPARV